MSTPPIAATGGIPPAKRPSISRILKTLEAETGAPIALLTGGRRPREIMRARHIGYWVAAQCGYSLPEVGAIFGGRDHTTIFYGVRKVENDKAMLAEAAQIAAKVQVGLLRDRDVEADLEQMRVLLHTVRAELRSVKKDLAEAVEERDAARRERDAPPVFTPEPEPAEPAERIAYIDRFRPAKPVPKHTPAQQRPDVAAKIAANAHRW